MDSLPVSTSDDHSAAVRRLEELRETHTQCQQELAATKQELEEKTSDALSAQEELQYFVYAASHDLQQPLRAIGTHAQLIQRQFSGSEEALELTKVIVDGAAQMNALITDLLKYSRTGHGAQPTPVNLKASLQWALYNLAKAIEQSGAKVTVGELPEILADEGQIASVFENILSNSIKYRGPDPPEVLIASEVEGNFHLISIRDNGVGIKPEYREKVFEPFKRLHSREIPGSGLGLSICRKIVKAHHGKIWVESDGENGSVVKFTVPL